jgi:hypothetical protein
MHRMAQFAIVSLMLSLVTGCGGKSGNAPTAPPVVPPVVPTVQEQEPNDVTPQALGTLGSEDIILAGTSASQHDIDLYSINLPSASQVFVSVAWSGSSDLDLAVLDTTRVFLNAQDTGSNPEHCTLAALAAGNYIVRVTEKSAGAKAYTLTIGSR